jgi:hypothetical protein
MKRDELQKILRAYMEEHGAMEFLWTVDDELLRPTIHHKRHEMICAQGDFRGTFDYNRGLLVVSIGVYGNSEVTPVTFSTCMMILNIDDGFWRAESKHFATIAEAQELADKVSDEFVDKIGTKLPTEDKLNEFLRPFGMSGHSEG